MGLAGVVGSGSTRVCGAIGVRRRRPCRVHKNNDKSINKPSPTTPPTTPPTIAPTLLFFECEPADAPAPEVLLADEMLLVRVLVRVLLDVEVLVTEGEADDSGASMQVSEPIS